MKEKFITRVTIEQAKNLEDLTDWEHITNMSDEEAQENALCDPDNQPLPKNLKGLKRIQRATKHLDK